MEYKVKHMWQSNTDENGNSKRELKFNDLTQSYECRCVACGIYIGIPLELAGWAFDSNKMLPFYNVPEYGCIPAFVESLI